MAAWVVHVSHRWTLSLEQRRPFCQLLPASPEHQPLQQHDKEPENMSLVFKNAARTATATIWMFHDAERVDRCRVDVTYWRKREIQNTAELFNMPGISPCVASATLAVEVKVILTARVKGYGLPPPPRRRPRLLSEPRLRLRLVMRMRMRILLSASVKARRTNGRESSCLSGQLL